MIIRIIIWIFALFVLSRLVLNYEKKKISNFGLIFWVLIWLIVVGFTTWPNISDQVAHYLGISRGTDAALYLAIILLFYLVFRLYIRFFDIESEITEIVKKVAVKNLKKKGKK